MKKLGNVDKIKCRGKNTFNDLNNSITQVYIVVTDMKLNHTQTFQNHVKLSFYTNSMTYEIILNNIIFFFEPTR